MSHKNEDIKETTMSFTASLLSSLASPSLVPLHDLPHSFFHGNKVVKLTTVATPRRQLSVSCSPAAKAANDVVLETAPTSASEVVSSFYAAINSHDLSSVTDLIAQDCVYEDLVFSSPFVGRTVNQIPMEPISLLSPLFLLLRAFFP